MTAMKKLFLLLALALPLLPLHAQEPAIIPAPLNLAMGEGQLDLTAGIALKVSKKDTAATAVSAMAIKWLEKMAPPSKNSKARFVIQTNPALPAEGYRLEVNAAGISLQGGSGAGLFYGLQTLMQLNQPWQDAPNPIIPYATIKDQPAFAYRGMHLDVGRHLFPVEFIKTYIDMLARYKMNRFHWHLTEDQGWRIEIKKYPKLQEVSAYRKETLIGHYNDQPHQFDGQRYGGYYTQDEVREIVAYAAERFITVIPEIELPGHAQAAIAAYPELGCTGKPVEVATKWGIFEDVYCPSEATFTFLEDVLSEVIALFPSEYIHIGGDECPKVQWEQSELCQKIIQEEGLKDEHGLQSYFIARIERFLNSRGRQIIGWDEILEGGLAPNATVMSWRGEAGGIEAAKQGHDVVMTPTTYCYFDYYQSTAEDEPLAIGGYLPLQKVYDYHPVPESLTEEQARHILGAQGNIWTEYMPTPEKVMYMAYPRMQALSEVVWSGKDKKGFGSFVQRLQPHLKWMEQEGIQAANHLFDLQAEVIGGQGAPVALSFSNMAGAGEIRVQVGRGREMAYDKPLRPVDGTYRAQTYVDGKPAGRSTSIRFKQHLGVGQRIELKHLPHPKYNGSKPAAILNGVKGSNERYGDAEWIGIDKEDFDALIFFDEAKKVSTVSFRFFHGPGQWINAPREVKVFALQEDGQYIQVGSRTLPVPEGKILEATLELRQPVTTRGLRVLAPNYGIIPAGQQGAGHRGWLFVDELIIE